MKSVVKAIIAGAVASFALGAAALAQAPATEGNLVVYASHPSEMVDHFTKMFGDKYGIRVTTVKAGTGELLVVNAGDDRVRLEWAPEVVEAAFDAGWLLDPNGYLAPVAVMVTATEDD